LLLLSATTLSLLLFRSNTLTLTAAVRYVTTLTRLTDWALWFFWSWSTTLTLAAALCYVTTLSRLTDWALWFFCSWSTALPLAALC